MRLVRGPGVGTRHNSSRWGDKNTSRPHPGVGGSRVISSQIIYNIIASLPHLEKLIQRAAHFLSDPDEGEVHYGKDNKGKIT